jgi:probable phosphomutase (TIGR03848 family)
VGLDEAGRGQAQALGRRIALAGLSFSRVVTSPLQRCVETVETLLREVGPGIPVQSDDRLGECRYGAWTGRALGDLAAEPLWRVVQDHPSAAVFPDGDGMPGEPLAGMAARAVAAVREHDGAVESEAGQGGIWLAVSHGDVIKAILADAAGLHLDQFQRIMVDPASVSVVRYTPRRPFVVRTNDVGGDLAGLLATAPGDGDAAVGGGSGAAGGAAHPEPSTN